MYHFGDDAEGDETDDDRPQDRVALGRMHDSDYANDRNRRLPEVHGPRRADFVTSRMGRSRVASRRQMSGCGAHVMGPERARPTIAMPDDVRSRMLKRVVNMLG